MVGARRAIFSLAAASILSACNNSDGGQDVTSAVRIEEDQLLETVITGSVGDGPITGGRVVVHDARGGTLASQSSNDQARYRIALDIDSAAFPLTITVNDGTDLVSGAAPSFELVAVVLEPGGEQTANLNPAGTLAVKLAERMNGGLSAANLATAIRSVNSVFGFGIDARGITDPIHAVIDRQNAASMVRSSEALGETVRRALDLLISGGSTLGANELVDALSADLVDGRFDGLGAEGADSRVAATTSVVAAQVALETMLNRLEVGNVPATGVLDMSIQQILGGDVSAPLTGSLNLTASMLTQARVFVDAARTLDDSPEVAAISDALAAVQPGDSPAQLEAALPDQGPELLDSAIMQALLASDAELNAVNEVVGEAAPADPPLANRGPTISGTPASLVQVGDGYEFQPQAADADGDTLSFAIANLPVWAAFDAATGRLSGTPAVGDVGTHADIRISVSDGTASAELTAFSITVAEQPNRPPTISGVAPASVTAGNGYEFVPVASDPDGDALTFSVAGLPSWAAFDAATGRLHGIPGDDDAGVYTGIRITVSDGADSASLPAFSITVGGLPNTAPTIGGVPAAQVVVGNSYVFTPTASDADGDVLSFAVSGLPGWAVFDTATGNLSGVPVTGDEGSYADIRISVTDGRDTAALSPFTIVVAEIPNSAPTIWGSPDSTVVAGSTYSFTPSVFDADGDILTFSVAGRPTWAAFDATSGRLFGTPSPTDAGTWADIRISVSDGRDSADLSPFTITVAEPPNTPPTISGQPPASVTVGSAYSFVPVATDVDGDALTFSITGRPAWASFSAGTGELSGTPVVADVGTWSGISISVSDGRDSTDLPPFAIEVEDVPNRAPTISGTAPGTVTVGAAYSFTPTASDADGDSLTFSIAGQPAWTQFDPATGRISGTPGASDVGAHAGIVITVSDGAASAALPAFAITVSDIPNQPPTITGAPATEVTVDEAYSFTPAASDPDGDALSFSIAGQPIWASFDPTTGGLSGVPMAGDEGSYPGIVISVSDGRDTDSLPAFTINVNGIPNSAPTIAGTPPTTVTAGDAYSFTPAASDADGDSLSFSIVGRPGWAGFDPASGRLSGTPQAADTGVYSGIRISVTDGVDSASLPAFAITVAEPPNTPPTISGSPATSVTVGEAYAFTPSASDADGDPLSFSVAGLPAWAGFDPGTGRVSGSPADGQEGTYSNIVVSVSDGSDTASLAPFSITVAPRPNQPPTISGSPATQVTVDSEYSFRPTASDPDGDPLNFSVTSMPAWAAFDPVTGRLSGTPSESEEGVYANVVISVSDGEDSASLPAFSITVDPLPNRPPTISGAPATSVVAGESYSFTPTASDPDGDSLTFSIDRQPSWASFDPSTGRLWGTPDASHVRNHPDVQISVSDGVAEAALPQFDVEVLAAPNQPPVISGAAPPEAFVGMAYSFTPTASDPDGDSLTFSISGLPGWASFDPATGELSGTPAAGDEGVYAGIRIVVSDGEDSATLPDFSISVVTQTLGSTSLSWDAPTESEDGSPLEDLAGFRVHYGTAPGTYSNTIEIPNPGVTTHLVENLSPGVWYFVVTAYDTSGNESGWSNEAISIIP